MSSNPFETSIANRVAPGDGNSFAQCVPGVECFEAILNADPAFARDHCLLILTVRGGQKPYYELRYGELVLRGVPVDPDPARFFREHPPRVTSYRYRIAPVHSHWPKAPAMP